MWSNLDDENTSRAVLHGFYFYRDQQGEKISQLALLLYIFYTEYAYVTSTKPQLRVQQTFYFN